MTRLYYTGRYLMKRSGRPSPNAFSQFQHQMPAPEVVMVSGRAAAGWSLKTWRRIAATRSGRLQEDMLAAIEQLEEEEHELRKKYKK